MPGHGASVSISRYSNPDILKVAHRSTREKYYKIYSEYVTKHLTEKQLADQYGYRTPEHISRIIKFVVFETDHSSKPENLKSNLDKLSHAMGKLAEEMNLATSVRDKMSIYAEMRRHIKLISDLEGLLKRDTNIIDLSDRRKMTYNANVERRIDEEDATDVTPAAPAEEATEQEAAIAAD